MTFVHRIGGRYCKHCGDKMPKGRRDTRSKRTLGLCYTCMRDPKVYPKCKGVRARGRGKCSAIAYHDGYCIYHRREE